MGSCEEKDKMLADVFMRRAGTQFTGTYGRRHRQPAFLHSQSNVVIRLNFGWCRLRLRFTTLPANEWEQA